MKRKTVLGILFTLLLISIVTFAVDIRLVKATGTIYIRPNGSVDPPTAPILRDGNVYTLTDNINDSIVIEKDNIIVDGVGYTLQGNKKYAGIDLHGRSNVTIKNIRITGFLYQGIILINSSNNKISGVTITENYGYGIYLDDSHNNKMFGNNITSNRWTGIMLGYSLNNEIYRNQLTNNSNGIAPQASSNNRIFENNITNNVYEGIRLQFFTSNNYIYHNNFINNTNQTYTGSDCVSIWDDGYPSGGNYWSDYEERYPNATEIDDSGIWDTPYVIDANNIDNYPFVEPLALDPPVRGDFNGDGKCNILDLVILAGKFGKKKGDPGYGPLYDLNNDNIINILDLVLCAGMFGAGMP